MAAFLPRPLPLPLPPAPLAAICFPKQMLNLELSNYKSLINDKENAILKISGRVPVTVDQ
jgi:hypothetical protein